MPEVPLTDTAGDLHALDTAAADARSLLRRAQRLAERVDRLGREDVEGQTQEAVEAVERVLATLEEVRAEERLRIKGRLRGSKDEESER